MPDPGQSASPDLVPLVPEHIDVCSTCGYGAVKPNYPCYRCGRLGITRFLPELSAPTMIEGGPMFAARLRAQMKARDVTQQALADHLGYTQAAVSYWVTGKRQPSLADLCRVAATFEVSTDYLLGLSDA